MGSRLQVEDLIRAAEVHGIQPIMNEKAFSPGEVSEVYP